MRDPRGRARFVKNPRAELRRGRRGAQALERDLAMQARVVAEKHAAHAADPELVHDDVRADLIAGLNVRKLFGVAAGRAGAVERAGDAADGFEKVLVVLGEKGVDLAAQLWVGSV